jgi:ComEC/Rec2-related protein
MHVGMLAALLFLLLRFLPSKWREGTVLVILTLYVLLAGAAPPSVRALGMIGIFLLLRMILLQADPLRVLALIAVFLLLVTPGLLYDIGFLYSFIITAALLAAARMFADVNKLIHAPVLLMQRSKDRRNLYNRTRPAAVMLSALGVTMTSFLAGMAISVRSRGLFLPGSIAANLLLLPLIPILFILLGAKIVIGWIHPAADRCAAFLLTAGFRVLDAVTAFAAGFFDALPVCRPSMGEIILFYAGLLIFLTARKMKFRLAALGITFLLMLLWVLLPLSASPFLAVLSSDAATPVMVIEADPGRNRAVVHNAPSADAAYAAADLLIRSGITRIEVLRLEKARKGYCRGAMALASQLPVCRLEIPQPCRKPLLTFLQTGFPPEKLQSLFSPAPEITIQNTPAGRKIIIGTKEYFQPYSNQTKTIVHQDP